MKQVRIKKDIYNDDGVLLLSKGQKNNFDVSHIKIELENLVLGAIFHDIGLTLLPKSVFHKTTKLTAVELSILRNHCKMGYAMMQETPLSSISKDIILQHHENLRESGSPNHLTEAQLLKASQIVMVSECFDTATTGRYHKKIKTPWETLEEMTLQSTFIPRILFKFSRDFNK